MSSPARSGIAPSDLVIFDSHAKAATLANWIATNQKGNLRRFSFSAFGSTDDHAAQYVDFMEQDRLRRILICTFDTFREPLMRPVVQGAGHALLVVSRNASPDFRKLWASFKENSDLLPNDASVRVALDGPVSVVKDSISPREGEPKPSEWIDINVGDCGAVWSLLEVPPATVVKPPISAAKTVSAPSGVSQKPTPIQHKGNYSMANATESLSELMKIDGALGGLIADYTSGMLLAKIGGGVNLDIAAAGNSEVIKSKLKTMAALGLKEGIEDILITLGTQYHIIRPIPSKTGLFMYLVLDKGKANLAMARFKVNDIEKSMAL